MRRVSQLALPALGLLVLAVLQGCGATGAAKKTGFVYKDLPVARGSAAAGAGHTITFKGTPLELEGTGIQRGDRLRDVDVAAADLSLINMADTRGTLRIISIVPSLDTTVCEQQTHYLSEKNRGLDRSVELITVSVDTPFAQSRFAEKANIQNVTFLSDYRGGEFGRAYGLLLTQPHLLARAVMVVDEANVIRYIQVTPELAQMPDMDAAFQAARDLMGKR